MSAPLRILIADDHALVREGIRRVLAEEPGYEVVAEAATGTEAVALAEATRPDVAVLDISMPGESGLVAAGRIRQRVPSTRVLILSMYENAEYLLEAMRAGAHGYLLKDSAATELRDAIRAVQAGDTYFSPAVARQLGTATRQQAEREHQKAALDLVSPREREVLLGVAEGLTNKEIAARLGISHRTVETHRESLMQKLGIRTVAGLTRLAIEQGLAPPGA
ncbi:MAG: response regulator transcription factor [Gemmatimonadales bacterium]|nr:response regulator transcription factor [Gemmatimonadales bacterium]